MSDERPSPDTLLAEAQQQEARQNRGRLKVFLGAAPGVGKTFAMLEEARARAAEGVDVLIGYAEPHIRTETEALLLGLEILPYKVVEYRNTKLKEFDLDAALKRRPALLCVDELAHSNAPGMRHPKRWQDVVELLDAGINVYTTLNVQHLESVNDIVQRVTGVKVRETLPDSVLEQADEVEMVDTSPEELLERLREGKVYTGVMAERAARNFFSMGNLMALRELALRQAAQRVDAQIDDFRRAHAVRETWAATERILVCVSPSPLSARLVRAGKRLAMAFKARWIAAYVETPRSANLSQADRRRIEENLQLAQQLGAEPVTLSGQDMSEELLAYAKTRNVTKIVIGKSARPHWRELLFGTVVDDLVRKSSGIDIYVIRGAADEGEQPSAPPPREQPWDIVGYTWAVILSLAATATGWLLYHGPHLPTAGKAHALSNTNVLMPYLLVVLWVATRHSRGAAILASFLGVLLYDLSFVPPYLRLSVSDQQYLVTFAVMLLTALVISTLTHRVREQADAARHRERRTSTLLALSRDLAAARGTDQAATVTVRHMADVLGSRTLVLLPDADGQLVMRADSSAGNAPDAKEMGVAQWAFDHEEPAGAGTTTLPAAGAFYLPMKSSRGTVGVVGIQSNANGAFLDAERRQLAQALASQSALAIERAILAEEARQAWERVEAEFLRNTLLSGVSHELRTPLAAITGAAATLVEAGESLPKQAQADMLETISSEAERMERLINNLLDMTRMESHSLSLKKEWQPLNEVIGSTLHHMDRRMQGRQVGTDIPSDLPLVEIDAVAIEQVLANLLDNAVEYTPRESPIEIIAQRVNGALAVEVADRGPGLPPGTEQRVFEKFFRIARPGSRRGIGLGLAIARGIVEAHGGQISAANRTGGGAVFRFTLPLTGQAPSVDSTA